MSADKWDKDAEHGEDFWKQGDWDDLHDGQLIAAVWPSGARIGTLYDAGAGTLYLTLNEHGNVSSVDSLREDGAALFVKATPPLPAEMYTAILASVKDRLTRCILFLYGETWVDGHGATVRLGDIESFEVVAAPVPVTANRVLDRLREVWSTNMDSTLDNIEQVRAEFVVTL